MLSLFFAFSRLVIYKICELPLLEILLPFYLLYLITILLSFFLLNLSLLLDIKLRMVPSRWISLIEFYDF